MTANEVTNNPEVLAVGYGAQSYVEMLLGLAAVVLVILVLAWLAKRYSLMSPGMGGVIKITAAISLGNRDRLALIDVGGKEILLGISPGRVNTLHVFSAGEKVAISETMVEGSVNGSGQGNEMAMEEPSTFAEKLRSAVRNN